VHRATSPLFQLFGGTQFDLNVVEEICAKALGVRR
jgi:hypothetical protein